MGHSLSNWICRCFKCTSTPRRLSHEGTEPLDSSSAVMVGPELSYIPPYILRTPQSAINFVP